MGRLAGKVCAITGAAGGIGEGAAVRFAREGAQVVLLDRNGLGLQQVAEAIHREGGSAEYVVTDMESEVQIIAAFQFIERTFGRLNVLHTNAWWAAKKKAAELTLAEWNKTMAVTLTAPFLCSKYAIPLLKQAGGGSIIHTSSVGGVVVFRDYADYITAKAGVIQLSKSIAVDYGADGIRCNAICPGIIATPSTKEDLEDPDYSQYLMSKCLTGRIGTPEDVASAALYLASDESAFVTGSVMMVDSGWGII